MSAETSEGRDPLDRHAASIGISSRRFSRGMSTRCSARDRKRPFCNVMRAGGSACCTTFAGPVPSPTVSTTPHPVCSPPVGTSSTATFSAVVRYLRTLIRAARWIEANRAEATRLIAQECSVGRDEIEACLEAGYSGKFLPRLSEELVETLAVMKAFLYERHFIAQDFALEGWIDPRPLAEAYRLEGLDRVAPGCAIAKPSTPSGISS